MRGRTSAFWLTTPFSCCPPVVRPVTGWLRGMCELAVFAQTMGTTNRRNVSGLPEAAVFYFPLLDFHRPDTWSMPSPWDTFRPCSHDIPGIGTVTLESHNLLALTWGCSCFALMTHRGKTSKRELRPGVSFIGCSSTWTLASVTCTFVYLQIHNPNLLIRISGEE